MTDLSAPLDLSMNSVAFAELLRRSVLIADESAVSDIEMLADEVYLNGEPTRWYDVRPMLDPNEASGELMDMNAARIDGLGASYGKPADGVRWYTTDDRRMAEVEAIVIENNVTEFVLANAKVVDKAIGFDELMGQG